MSRQATTDYCGVSDEQEGMSEDGRLSWYDSRRNNPDRSAEYRLYYFDNGITPLMKEGDSFFVATRRDGSTMVIITPEGSTIESQLAWLFGIEGNNESFESAEVTEGESFHRLDFAARYLDEIGIDAEEPEADILDTILEKCGDKFPATHDFSRMARESLSEISAMDNADEVLMAWLEREELLFRRLERHIVSERLKTGFIASDIADVDGFIAFSLSVQNRRKSRAGYSLEHHLTALLKARGMRFERGVETENRNRPDFIFPGQKEYRDAAFDPTKLTMLGAKSTCKDRWRQVLSEASRIKHKHLITLEPGITKNQTDEMKAKHLQLVVPVAIQATYKPSQQEWLMDVTEFLRIVKTRQAGTLG
jgi:hypothetical protein